MRTVVIRLLRASLIAGAACATVAVPSDQLARSEAALRAAEEAGASKFAPATLQLQLAKDKIQQARDLIKEGDNQRAEARLSRAQVDANLALALTRAANARAEAEAAESRARADTRPAARGSTK